MTAANNKRADLLGMPWGTAQNRLRKLILFDLVSKLGLSKCFVCKEEITSADTLSIEHKIAWMDQGPETFWDLDNIAFSHRRCNRPHKNGSSRKTHCPAGHEYTSENTYVLKKGYRRCRKCRIELYRRRKI